MVDQRSRFLFSKQNIRGVIVDLEHSYQELLAHTDHSVLIQELLGEASVASCLLAATIKSKGSLSLQVQANALLSLLVVQVDAERTFRGMARIHSEAENIEQAQASDLYGEDARLVITLDPGEGKKRYQGITEISDSSLLKSVENYLERSEQLPTRLWLAAEPGRRAQGLLLQQLPDADLDYWQHLMILTETLQDEELLELSSTEILTRLYHAEDIQVFPADSLSHRCSCTEQRVLAMILQLGVDEVRDIMTEQGKLEVTCQYCSRPYLFDSVDVEGLFKTGEKQQLDDKIH